MSSLKSHRVPGPSGLFLKLAGLLVGLLPLAARADEPAPTPPPAAPLTSGSALDPESVVPGLLAAGQCGAALQTLAGMEPSQRHAHEVLWFCRAYHQCGEPRDALAACSLVATQGEVFSQAERVEAQGYAELAMRKYQQSLAASSAAAVGPAPAPELPVPPPAPRPVLRVAADAPPVWQGQSSFYFHARPVWSLFTITGGAVIDVGYEHIFKSGFLLGAELAPVALVFPLVGVQGQVRLGYGSRRFTIGVSGGAGVLTSIGSRNESPIYVPQTGIFFRAGRLDRTYVEFALNLGFIKPSSTSATFPIPYGGLIHISSRTAEKWRFNMDIGGSYYLFGPYLLFGGERQLGSSEHGYKALNFGFGLLFPVIAYGIPGPMLSIGYQRRF